MDPFEALAEPVRRRIVEILASGEHTSGQLADIVGFEFRISRTAVSKHLRLLRDAGYVDVRGDQRWRWYRLDRRGLTSLENAVAEIRLKTLTAVGWDADTHEDHDPLRVLPVYPRVPFKGPGRGSRRGRRGRQSIESVTAGSSDPDAGLYPVYPVPTTGPVVNPGDVNADAPSLDR